MILPFKESNKKPATSLVLAGDIGATKSNLSLFQFKGDRWEILKETKYKTRNYKNINELTDIFRKDLKTPDSICLGVAGPVLNGRAKLSNIDWQIDKDELSRHCGGIKVQLVNDLEATAFGLAMLEEKDLFVLHAGDGPPGNAAVIAPGTGLGEAGIYWDGSYFHPFATEGGHCDFAPRNEFDFDLYKFLQNKFGHVSWERLVCGPGIMNIYHFLRDEKRMDEPQWLRQKLEDTNNPAVVSAHTAEAGICKKTMELFTSYLAYESANLVLKLKATGGLFIGGGIAPKITPVLEKNKFFDSFCQSGRLNYLLERVPVKIIMNERAALLGAAWHGSKN